MGDEKSVVPVNTFKPFSIDIMSVNCVNESPGGRALPEKLGGCVRHVS